MFLLLAALGCSRHEQDGEGFLPAAPDEPGLRDLLSDFPADPAALVVVRPALWIKGRPALRRVLVQSGDADQPRIKRALNSENLVGAIAELAPTHWHWPHTLDGWDQTRPVLAALGGTDDDDPSLLFRALLMSPGDVRPRAVRHRILLPATDSETLRGSLQAALLAAGFSRRPDDGATFVDQDAGALVALTVRKEHVTVEVLTDAFPLALDGPGRWAALKGLLDRRRSGPPTPSFQELSGARNDLIVMTLRARNLRPLSLLHGLATTAAASAMAPAEKFPLTARGAAETTADYLTLSRKGDDLAIGLRLDDIASVRVAGSVDGDKEARLRRSVPLGSLMEAIGGGGRGCGWICGASALIADPVNFFESRSSSVGASVSLVGKPRPRAKDTADICLDQALKAMQSTFLALADVSPERRSSGSAQGLTNLERALACARKQEATSETAHRIQLALALYASEQMGETFRRDEQLRILDAACGDAGAEACLRAKQLRAVPAPALARTSACALPLPRRFATVTVTEGGAVFAGSVIPNGPILLAADGRASFGAVMAVFSKLPVGVVSIAVLGPGETPAALPLLRLSREVSDQANLVVLRPNLARREVTLATRHRHLARAPLPASCAPGSPCPLASALRRLHDDADERPTLFLDVDAKVPWQKAVDVLAAAMCVGTEINQAALLTLGAPESWKRPASER